MTFPASLCYRADVPSEKEKGGKKSDGRLQCSFFALKKKNAFVCPNMGRGAHNPLQLIFSEFSIIGTTTIDRFPTLAYGPSTFLFLKGDSRCIWPQWILLQNTEKSTQTIPNWIFSVLAETDIWDTCLDLCALFVFIFYKMQSFQKSICSFDSCI